MAGFYENITVSAAVPNAAADAEAAKDAAVIAKNEAEAAKVAAEAAQSLAEQHKDTASGYVGTVSGAQSIADANVASTAGDKQAAEDARDLALAYRQAASVSALSAENSANSVSANAATVAGMADDINTVAGLQNTLATVAFDLGIGNTMATIRPYMNQIDTVSGITTEVIAVAADAPDIGTVATDLTGSNNIGTVAGLAPKINTVAGLSSELTTVHGNNADITTVATSLNAGNIIANVSSSIGNVNNVGNKLAEIEAVQNALSDIAAVENKLTEIDSVSDSITNVDSVAGVISEVQTVAGVSDEVANLSKSTGNMATLVSKLDQTTDLAGAVTDAQNSATSASSSASTATTQATTASGHATTAATHAANLGSVAYQDLTAIAESKSETAVDVFVYDTSKDSDGGAWRNRTQGTSWHNEALNTSIRGATKKFPAVAVIVAESTKVTIYDADDPSMPMWFTSRNTTTDVGEGVLRQLNAYNPTCVSAKDGKVFVGINISGNYASNEGLHYLDFVKDEAGKHVTSSANTGKVTPLTAYPNTNVTSDSSMGVLSSADVNDIAVTVLPNAPIDPDTGLPVPTIAVATAGGVSVIKDDGSVVDITAADWTLSSRSIKFLPDNKLYFSADGNTGANNRAFYVEPIPDSDLAYLGHAEWQNVSNVYERYIPTVGGSWAGDMILAFGNGGTSNITCTDTDLVLSNSKGLARVSRKQGSPSKGMQNITTSSYNTGWMNGDIKLATLMDTTAETISAPELVTNGDGSSTTGWSSYRGATLSVSGGNFVVSANTGSYGGSGSQGFTTVVGETYTLSFQFISATSLNSYIAVRNNPNAGSGTTITAVSTSGLSAGMHSATFTATGTTTYITVVAQNPNDVTTVDNISVVEAVADRSVNNNGLNIVGNVTKSAVATGAELVGYGGFSSSNRLVQPYNSDLDFGTGDFSIMAWVKTKLAPTQYIIDRSNKTDNTNRLNFLIGGTNSNLFCRIGVTTVSTSFSFAVGSWYCVAVCRQNGVLRFYVNGNLIGTGANTQSNTGNYDTTLAGYNAAGGQGADGTSLLRISATAPTAEQIAKIYRDEKPLFQVGAKCTLSADSDTVHALAYDEDLGVLHASCGFSADVYRDEFVGLQKVQSNLLSTSSSVAISAANGLVVEE